MLKSEVQPIFEPAAQRYKTELRRNYVQKLKTKTKKNKGLRV